VWRGEVVVAQSGRIQIEEVRVDDQNLVVSIALAYCGGILPLLMFRIVAGGGLGVQFVLQQVSSGCFAL
jgi:hypothetical protein